MNKYSKKEKQTRANRVNVADEILDVLGMVNYHMFVQAIIHNENQVPNLLYRSTNPGRETFSQE